MTSSSLNSRFTPTTKIVLLSTPRWFTGWALTALPKETLLWLRDLKSVIDNQRTSDGKIATLSRIVREELWPEAEAKFAADGATEDLKSQGYTAAVNALITKIFPTKALNKQKSYMHRQLRKPVDMTVRLYIERVQLLNTYLKEFPPFNSNQALPDWRSGQDCVPRST